LYLRHSIVKKDGKTHTYWSRELRLRCVVQPNAAQRMLIDRLGLRLPERLRLPQLAA